MSSCEQREAGNGFWPPDSFAPAKPIPVSKIAQRSIDLYAHRPFHHRFAKRLKLLAKYERHVEVD
jgi:hypothetical protein